MYRIKIDPEIDDVAKEFERKALEKNIRDNLIKFKDDLKCTDKQFETKAKTYVQKIVDLYVFNGIISKKPSSFNVLKDEFESIISPNALDTKVRCHQKKRNEETGKMEIKDVEIEFGKRLTDVMDYECLKKEYYDAMNDVGINVCAYCNMGPADSSDDGIANFQMEHFWPKNIFPFLSTSFFNFFPSCGECNTKKGSVFDENGFDLYREKESEIANPFLFKIPNAVLVYAKMPKSDKKKATDEFGKNKEVKILFDSTRYANQQMEKLQIQERYNCNRVRKKIFNLLYKYERYTKKQIKVTQNTFKKLDSLHVNNIFDVFEDYSSEEDIHKAQLTKISIDFGKETGML